METSSHEGLTIVGLGPGPWESLTIEAAELLHSVSEVYVRTASHPVVVAIARRLPEGVIRSFDGLAQSLTSDTDVYERIADDLRALAERPGGAVYAVPGSPSVGEAILHVLRERHVPFRLIQGLNFIEPVLAAAGVTDSRWIEVIDASEMDLLARENAVGEVDGHQNRLAWRAPVPTSPLLVSYVSESVAASGVSRWLRRFYPDNHPLRLVRAAGTAEASVRDVPLRELDGQTGLDLRTALYVPPLTETDNVRTFAGLMQLTRTLRAPGGCPWDREQTHATLKPHLLEETYEVLDALDGGNPADLCEEMGDLLFQITIHSQIAAESGAFTIEDVIQNIMCKLIGRHPHVFGEMELESAQDVRQAWESFKQREKPKRSSVFEQIPRGLPALPQSNLMQKRAASVGFEWPSVAEVLDKVDEEVRELRQEIEAESARETQREELGDILFALVSVARHLRIDPEEALRLANRKFAARFQYVESRVSAQGKALKEVPPAELDEYWNEAKLLGAPGH